MERFAPPALYCHISVLHNSRGHGNATLLLSLRETNLFPTLAQWGSQAAMGQPHRSKRANESPLVFFCHSAAWCVSCDWFEWGSCQKQTAGVHSEYLAHPQNKRCGAGLCGKCGPKCKYCFSFVCFYCADQKTDKQKKPKMIPKPIEKGNYSFYILVMVEFQNCPIFWVDGQKVTYIGRVPPLHLYCWLRGVQQPSCNTSVTWRLAPTSGGEEGLKVSSQGFEGSKLCIWQLMRF